MEKLREIQGDLFAQKTEYEFLDLTNTKNELQKNEYLRTGTY